MPTFAWAGTQTISRILSHSHANHWSLLGRQRAGHLHFLLWACPFPFTETVSWTLRKTRLQFERKQLGPVSRRAPRLLLVVEIITQKQQRQDKVGAWKSTKSHGWPCPKQGKGCSVFIISSAPPEKPNTKMWRNYYGSSSSCQCLHDIRLAAARLKSF